MYRYLEILQTDLHIKCVSHSESGALADLCQLDNGGCEQVCYNLCNLKVQCDCWPGYTLAYDGKTCMGKHDSSVLLYVKMRISQLRLLLSFRLCDLAVRKQLN